MALRSCEGAEELAVEVEGEDGVEELRGLLLEDHVRSELGRRSGVDLLLLDGELAALGGHLEDLVALGLDALRRERDEGTGRGQRGDHRHEGSVEELDAVELAGVVRAEHLAGDLSGLLGGRRVAARHRLADQRTETVALAEVLAGLDADGDQLNAHALRLELIHAVLSLLDDLRVVAAAEAAVAGDDEEANILRLAALEKWDVERLGAQAGKQAAEDALEGL